MTWLADMPAENNAFWDYSDCLKLLATAPVAHASMLRDSKLMAD